MANTPRAEYPRPDFERESYVCLNGEWDFAYDDDNQGIVEKWYNNKQLEQKIIVPYTYLCEMSGINNQDFHDIVWYKKEFAYNKKKKDNRVILHFGAIDYVADIWVDGVHLSHHEGGNTPIEVDITAVLGDAVNHVITVRAEDDSFDFEMPRGKQFWKKESESIFYTRTVGIWQTVWLEEVADNYLKAVRIASEVDTRMVDIELQMAGKSGALVDVTISLAGTELLKDTVEIKGKKARRKYWLDSAITLDWNHQESWTWSPENPVLFDIEYAVKNPLTGEVTDKVKGYFAFRKIDIVNGKIMLNNRPYYMKMVLDQGYWRKSLLTAPTDEALKADIEYAKLMGFNGARKHQKVEDPRYLYWADKLGFLVWGESPSSYEYSELAVQRHMKEWLEILQRDYNHPSIIVWVPLNESWGVHEIQTRKDEQAHSLALYHMIKSIDQTRLVISNDGWTHTKSDILTIHDYTGERDVLEERYSELDSIVSHFPGGRTMYAEGYEYDGEPIMVTEFGGISYSTDNAKGWGYTSADEEEEFLEKYRGVVEPLLKSKSVQGFVYTQLADVEQEINGLMTYDREFKVEPSKIKEING